VGDAIAVTVTVIVFSPVELAVVREEVGIGVVDELSSSPSQSPSSFGSFESTESVLSFPVMPPSRPPDTKR
jgi:hypothetical protein